MHINEIKLPEDDDFSRAFNACSDLYIKAHDKNLSKEERDEYLELWFQRRQCLELGIN